MKEKQTAERIFFGLAIFNIVMTYLILLFSKGNFVTALTYDESNFKDFWDHIGRLLFSPHIYATDADAIFPPLAYLFLKMFAYPLSYKAEMGQNVEEISRTGYGILMVVLYVLVFVWLLASALHIFYRTESEGKKSALLGIFLFSYLVWGFALERGNLVIYAMVFLMFGLALRDSPNRILRELSLIFVAISAGLKLYPALFGLLWIAEKRYREAVRLVLYGLCAFFLPFLFVDSPWNYMHTFSQYLDKNTYSHASIWTAVFSLFGNSRYTQIFCKVLVAAIVLWAVFLLFADGINWKTITLLMATQTAIIPESYVYTYVFIIIPVVYFLNETVKRKIDYVYAALFALLFTFPPILTGGRGRLPVVIWSLILLMVSADEIGFLVKRSYRRLKEE